MRAAGTAVGLLTAGVDLAKGAGAIWCARALMSGHDALPWAEAMAAFSAVAGHNWSIFLGFRGGAGTMPNLGAAILLWPIYGLVLIPAGLAMLLTSGYASLASLFVAVAIPAGFGVRAWLGSGSWAYACFGLATAVLVIIALLPNIKRLIAGTERMVGPRARSQGRRPDGRQL